MEYRLNSRWDYRRTLAGQAFRFVQPRVLVGLPDTSLPDPRLSTPLAAKVKKPVAAYRSGFFAIKLLDQRNSKENPGLSDSPQG